MHSILFSTLVKIRNKYHLLLYQKKTQKVLSYYYHTNLSKIKQNKRNYIPTNIYIVLSSRFKIDFYEQKFHEYHRSKTEFYFYFYSFIYN